MIMEWCFRAPSPSQHNHWGPNKRRTIESVTVPSPRLETVSEIDETDDSEDEPTADVAKALQGGEDSDSERTDDIEENVDSVEAAGLSEESGAEEHAQSDAEEIAREMNAIGFALIKSAELLPAASLKAKNCIAPTTFRTMHASCTPKQLATMQHRAHQFFSRPAVRQSTPWRKGKGRAPKLARVIKPNAEINSAWKGDHGQEAAG